MEVGIGIYADDFQTHIIGFMKCHHGGSTKGFGQVIAKEFRLGATEVEEKKEKSLRWSFLESNVLRIWHPSFELALQLLSFLLEGLVSLGSFSSCNRGSWLDGFFEMLKLT